MGGSNIQSLKIINVNINKPSQISKHNKEIMINNLFNRR